MGITAGFCGIGGGPRKFAVLDLPSTALLAAKLQKLKDVTTCNDYMM